MLICHGAFLLGNIKHQQKEDFLCRPFGPHIFLSLVNCLLFALFVNEVLVSNEFISCVQIFKEK